MEIVRALPHVAAALCMARQIGLDELLPDGAERQRNLALALIVERLIDPAVHMPLMWIDKAQTWNWPWDLGGNGLVDLVVEETHTCYLSDRRRRHPWGYGCGECPACQLRADGFQRYRAGTLMTGTVREVAHA